MLPDQKNGPLELLNPVILIFGQLPELIDPVTSNFQVIPEIVCRRLSPSLLSMWGALVLVNQVKSPNQVTINQVMN